MSLSALQPAGRPVVPRGSVRRSRGRQTAVRPRAGLISELVKPFTGVGKVDDLKTGIKEFYDESSGLWEEMWGEHMHHGFYPKDGSPKTNQQAQIDMIEEALKVANVTKVTQMVDVGCGIGGSSRYIAKKYGCRSNGITLSPKQAERANVISRQQGFGDRLNFQVADALAQPFPDNSFDLVWSMESGEHMPDKRRFVSELARVCAPGGSVIVVTWCHRVLQPGESSLTAEEQEHLARICEAYYLPAWCSVEDYRKLFEAHGLEGVEVRDWSEEVSPFWKAVIQTALTGQGLAGLMKAGWTTIKGALVMPLMADGLKMGIVKMNVITARKPL